MSREYEKQLEGSTLIISEETCKRLMSAMSWGVIITYGNGHRWIYCFDVDEIDKTLNDILQDAGFPHIRAKCYGTLIDALNRIDGALKILTLPSLLEKYEAGKDYAWH